MSEQFQVSQSKVKAWLQCRCAYHYKYVLKIKRKLKSRPLMFGIIMHELLEAHVCGRDWKRVLKRMHKERGKLFAAERAEYGDILEDARLIFEAYLEHYGSDSLRYILYKGSRAEHWIEVEVEGDIKLVMKIDAFARTPNKLRWLVENKTGKSIPSVDERWRNLQTAVYFRGAEMMGITPFDGVCWNFITSKAPTIPQVNKDGKLSLRQINTLPAVVRATITANNLKAKDYKVLIERAERSASEWFERDFTPRREATIDSLFQDFVETAQEMQDFHGKRKQRTIGKHCGWCDYERICRAELTGGDPEYVIEREYTIGSKEDDKQKPKRRRKAVAK